MMNKLTLKIMKIYTIIFLVVSCLSMLTFNTFGIFFLDLALYVWSGLDFIFCILVLKLINKQLRGKSDSSV